MDRDSSELISWFKKAAGTEKCTVELEGMKEKGDGYVADIIFAKVTLDEPHHNGKQLYLAAKASKTSLELRKLLSEICQREVAFYRDIVPIFQQFQQEKSLKEPFQALPKCYTAFQTENAEVIIQENMTIKGYVLHNRRIPMNINHIKLVLSNYAKFHAISLAIRDQKPKVFETIEKTCYDMVLEKISMIGAMYEKSVRKVIKNLNEVGRMDLKKRYEKLVEPNVVEIVKDLLLDVPDERVLTHADCHNGNFMFEYKDGNEESPINMVLLDFQVTFVFSPILDLSTYLYCGASKEEFSHFTELMEFYHDELSSFLAQLGSDVNKLFPISTMWQHWKKYSFYGFNYATTFLELMFIDSDAVPEFKKEQVSPEEFLNINLKDKTKYLERLLDIIEHYLDFNNIH
ncbi:unnamed protein product [Psylliodes chrysocephalus]|uniref:CHK kinase-like domain-containing protein n=1 Tax=Psylliodes chrysocephalus TaxID=3402493 RepID=A0A9P0GJ74_9CUCU|nr:unnamed protein product [Psylliodes chrysocephala]